MPFTFTGKVAWLLKYFQRVKEYHVLPRRIVKKMEWPGSTVNIPAVPANSILVAFFVCRHSSSGADCPTSLTRNGRTLTRQIVRDDNYQTGAAIYTQVAPDAGEFAISTVGGSYTSSNIVVALFSGVDQSSPIIATGQSGNTATPLSVTLAVELYAMMVECGVRDANPMTFGTPGGGQSQIPVSPSTPYASLKEIIAPAASDSMSRSFESAAWNIICALVLRAAGG